MAQRKSITSLVTGGAGFIGSHTVDALLGLGHRVVVVDNLSTGSRRNLDHRATLHKISVTNAVGLQRIFRRARPTYVFHLAAQKDVRRSVADPAFDAQENIIGSLNVLQASVLAGVRKVIFASSGGAIYGDGVAIPTPETALYQPASPYGIAKLTVEYYLHYYTTVHGLAYAALRYANVYGPRQDPFGEAGVVAIFCKRLLAGEPTLINGHGRQTRDYVFVADVAAANVRAMQSKKSGSWNIGTGKETDVNALYRMIAAAAGVCAIPQHGPAKAGEQQRSAVNHRKAARDLGWRPLVVLTGGIQRTVTWFKQISFK